MIPSRYTHSIFLLPLMKDWLQHLTLLRPKYCYFNKLKILIIHDYSKIFDGWDRLSGPSNEDELRLALSKATGCFKIQQQLVESYLKTVQDDQLDTESDVIQDKHTVVRKKLFQMGKAISKVELEKMAENVTTNRSFGDATQHQPQVANLPQIQLSKFDGKFTDWIAFIDQFNTAVHLNTKLSNSQRLVYLKCCLSGPLKS